MKCIICQEKSAAPETHYCQSHNHAFEGMKHAFASWQNAYGSLTLQDFLDRVIGLPGMGRRAREVAEFLRENPGRWT